MANFAEIADIEAFLQVEISTAVQIASAERALTEASAAIRNYCKQYLELVEDDEIALDVFGPNRGAPLTNSPRTGGSRLFLPELPVVSVTSVAEDGEALTVDDDYKLGSAGILHRINAKWMTGIQVVTITYTHGYATIPDDIIAVATRAAARGYQAGLRSAENEALAGVQSKSLGDYSVSFGSEQGGGVSEGVLGASAARFLLMSEQDILDRYRIKRV